MATIAGASQYLNSATLANTQGLAAQKPTLLGSSATAVDILDAAKSALRVRGIGISSSARALNNQLLSNSTSINELFSYGAGSDATVEGMQQQILALRSSLSDNQLSREVRGDAVDKKA